MKSRRSAQGTPAAGRSLSSAWEERFGSALSSGWCCAWIEEVQKKAAEGNVICCAVSNIFLPDAWLSHFRLRPYSSLLCRWLEHVHSGMLPVTTPKGLPCAALAAEDWVEDYGAGSSELSDARVEEFGLRKRLGHGHVS